MTHLDKMDNTLVNNFKEAFLIGYLKQLTLHLLVLLLSASKQLITITNDNRNRHFELAIKQCF